MPALDNFVAIDWRSGPDRIYFFFQDNDTYSRFDIGDNKVPEGYPGATKGSWDAFDPYTKKLQFGFTTTSSSFENGLDEDISWLFFYDGDTPTVCKYNQDKDKVDGFYKVADTIWAPITDYFFEIMAATWDKSRNEITFLLHGARYMSFDCSEHTLTGGRLGEDRLGALFPYSNRIITAAQNDRTFADSYWYIFLTDNQYLVYNIDDDNLVSGPKDVNDGNWPGLLRD
ncbi:MULTISPECIES: hypothetical protein [Pseudomonas]|uniref:hypothetical protein n=1 Tax=Pseudomonas TaxID=286 RepID=UPI001B32CE69|nr:MULTISPECIES: hypothetical protein [Pseudomonas]MBP5945214.1 hypothetical protein [Pseudomonas sp. P9(2020)]MBP5955856.1 hypothetical protein [Pseudomonas anatoliensis]MBZ9563912.1 hypothetical protein [Pseudomonas sp. P116]